MNASVSPEDMERARDLLARVSRVFDQRLVGQQPLRTALTSALLAGGH